MVTSIAQQTEIKIVKTVIDFELIYIIFGDIEKLSASLIEKCERIQDMYEGFAGVTFVNQQKGITFDSTSPNTVFSYNGCYDQLENDAISIDSIEFYEDDFVCNIPFSKF